MDKKTRSIFAYSGDPFELINLDFIPHFNLIPGGGANVTQNKAKWLQTNCRQRRLFVISHIACIWKKKLKGDCLIGKSRSANVRLVKVRLAKIWESKERLRATVGRSSAKPEIL